MNFLSDLDASTKPVCNLPDAGVRIVRQPAELTRSGLIRAFEFALEYMREPQNMAFDMWEGEIIEQMRETGNPVYALPARDCKKGTRKEMNFKESDIVWEEIKQ